MSMQRAARFIGRGLVAALLLLSLAAPSFAVGTVVLTSVSVKGGYTKYTFAWTSDAAGAVSGNAQSIAAGRIVQAQFTPGGGGTQPTDLYDAVLNEAAGADVLAGAGANLSNATSKLVLPSAAYLHDAVGTLDLVVSNAGNAKTGTAIIWVGP